MSTRTTPVGPGPGIRTDCERGSGIIRGAGGGCGMGTSVATGAEVTMVEWVGSETLGRSGILEVTTVGRAAIVTEENAAVEM